MRGFFSLSAKPPTVDFTGFFGGVFVFLARMRISDFLAKSEVLNESFFLLSAKLPTVDFTGVCGGGMVFVARMRISDFLAKSEVLMRSIFCYPQSCRWLILLGFAEVFCVSGTHADKRFLDEKRSIE